MKEKLWKILMLVFVIVGLFFLFLPVLTAEESINDQWSATTFDEIDELRHDYFIKEMNIMSLDPEDSDQWITNFEGSPPLNFGISNIQWILQTGYNDRSPLTGFLIPIMEHGTCTESLYIGFLYSSLTKDPSDWNNWIWVGALSPCSLPQKDTFYWVGYDFENEPLSPPINAGTEWRICCISAQNMQSTNSWWGWACRDDNPYNRGMTYGWDGSRWNGDPNYDCLFVTYTVEAPQPDPPVISISISSWVVASQGTGMLCLIGAVISGFKGFGIYV